MGILFRKQASTNEKWFSVAWYVVIGLATYGLIDRFHPKPYMAGMCALLSVPLATLAWWPIHKDTHPANKLSAKPFFVRASVHTVILVFAWAFIWIALSKGVPSLLTKHLGESTYTQALITHKSSGMGSRFGCAHYLIVDDQSPKLDNDRLCVSKEFWQTMAVGSVIQIERRTSPLGYLVKAHE